MEAGYVDAGPVIAGTLRELAALRAPVPVLSLYLDLDPSEFATQPARSSAVTSLIDTAHKRIEGFDTDHDGRVSLRADLERAETFFHDFSRKRGRGAALFAASAADMFRPYLLPRPTHTRVVIDDSPYVTPLVHAADLRDWLIVLVDSRHARFLHGNTDHVEEIERVKDKEHEGAGPSDGQRHAEKDVEEHLKHAAHELDDLLKSNGYERVILGGPPEILPRLENSHMSNPARERIAGHVDVAVPATVPDDVRRATTDVFEEHERSHEREVLERLRARLAKGERAVAGVEDVREMLVQRRVETLLYDEREAPPDSVLEPAIEEAVGQSAEVLPLRYEPDALAPHGYIAAVLRF